jgi:repressor LexA
VSTFLEQLPRLQALLLEWLREYFAAHEESPTLQQICDRFGWRSRSTAAYHLRGLARAGFVERLAGAHRNIRLKEVRDADRRRVPLLGYVAAGKPIIASLDEHWVSVPDEIDVAGGRRFYALIAKGDSMTEAGILDGDRLIVESKPVAENGQIIIGYMDRGAVVKRYFRRGGRVRLESASRGYKPLVVGESDEFSIQGILRGVVRVIN